MKKMSILLLLALLAVLMACSPAVPDAETQPQEDVSEESQENLAENAEEELPQEYRWQDTDLVDVRTSEMFRIADFQGIPILVESFAIWCPVCTNQQEEIKKLHEQLGDAVVSVSLDTDPNEDESIVLQAVEERDFDWRFAVAPREMTEALIEQFGISIANAPAAPVILVCEDQSSRLLPSGIKDVEELKEELAKGC